MQLNSLNKISWMTSMPFTRDDITNTFTLIANGNGTVNQSYFRISYTKINKSCITFIKYRNKIQKLMMAIF